MLRQAELWRVLGRRLTERLLRAGWIEPVHAQSGGVFYSARDVHRALKRVQNEGYLLGARVRSGSVSDRPKVPKRSLEGALENLPVEELFPE